MHFRPRFSKKRENLITLGDQTLELVNVCLGIFFVSARNFKFSWITAKQMFTVRSMRRVVV